MALPIIIQNTKSLEAMYSEVVTLHDEQTIGGVKTFSGKLICKNSNPICFIQGSTVDKSVVHTSTSRFAAVGFYDKNGLNMVNRVGVLRVGFTGSNDGTLVELLAHNPDTSDATGLTIVYPRGGTPYMTAITPEASSNTNHIATTAWVCEKGVLTSRYKSGDTWYRKYSDGWIEQGGTSTTEAVDITISFPLSFTTTNIQVLSGSSTGYSVVRSKTKTSFVMGRSVANTTYWYACGY